MFSRDGWLMGIVKRFQKGKWNYGVSRRLPGNKLGMKRFRRWYEKKVIAKDVLDRLNGAIANGMIDDVLPGLVGMADQQYSIETFWNRFRDEYCKPRLTSWKRYKQSFTPMVAELGSIPLQEFRRHHLHEYLEKRVKTVSRSTANKDIAAIKKMFSFALEVGAIEQHPLIRFPTFRVQETALRLPTVEEFHTLVDAMEDPAIRALVAVLGETAIRKSEALDLTWDRVDLRQYKILVEKTKGKKVRSIPLSEFAVERLRQVLRFIHQPYVFCYQAGQWAGKRIRRPYKQFHKAAAVIGLDWISFHTLRHFRATQWLRHGVDIRTVKDTLGHSSIATTVRYLKHIETHADKVLREAQEIEKKKLQISAERDKSGTRED